MRLVTGSINSGVLTVVAKLFGAVGPDIAVFGRKDAQQCLVIAQMVEDLKMGIRLIDGPTIREPDGLAMSSRNRYLDKAERARALCLSGALASGRGLLAAGERRREKIVGTAEHRLDHGPGVGLAGQDDHRDQLVAVLDLGQQVDSVLVG